MWGNLASRIGNVAAAAAKAMNEIESTLDAAVGLDDHGLTITPSSPLPPARTENEDVDEEASSPSSATSTGDAELATTASTTEIAAPVSPVDKSGSGPVFEDVNLESPQPPAIVKKQAPSKAV